MNEIPKYGDLAYIEAITHEMYHKRHKRFISPPTFLKSTQLGREYSLSSEILNERVN